MKKALHKLAIPTIITGFAEPIISLADTILIGHLGAQAVGGMGISISILFLLTWVIGSGRNALAAEVAQLLGKAQFSLINVVLTQTFILFVAISVIVAISVSFAISPILHWYQAEGAVFEYAKDYFLIRIMGLPFLIGAFVLFGYAKGMQNTRTPLYITLAAGMVNLLLDLALIHGIPPYIEGMGLKGAAIASVCAHVTMFLAAIFLLKKQHQFSFSTERTIHPHVKITVANSGNLVLRTAALNFTFIWCNRYATSLGDVFIATQTILFNLWMFCAFFLDGYAHAGLALTGKYKGQQNDTLIIQTTRYVLRVNLIIAGCLGVILFAVKWPIAQLVTDDVALSSSINNHMIFLCATLPFSAYAFTYDGIFIGLARIKLLRNVLIISTFFVFLPLFEVLTRALEPHYFYIWLSIFVWLGFRGIVPHFYFKNQYKTS